MPCATAKLNSVCFLTGAWSGARTLSRQDIMHDWLQKNRPKKRSSGRLYGLNQTIFLNRFFYTLEPILIKTSPTSCGPCLKQSCVKHCFPSEVLLNRRCAGSQKILVFLIRIETTAKGSVFSDRCLLMRCCTKNYSLFQAMCSMKTARLQANMKVYRHIRSASATGLY